jgi:predicted permease
MLNRFRLWLRTVVFRGRLEREMHDEMAVHLARSMERLVASGMAPEEARRAARREFGHVESIQEEARDARGARGIESIGADVRFGLRQFARRPFSALTMIVVLAIGIGFNTALFVFLYSFVTSPPSGIERQESLVRIRGIDRSTSPGQIVGREFSYPEYREYAAQQDLFSAVAAWTSSDVVLDVGGNGERLHSGAATYVTANYFQVLGVNPILGVSLPAAAPDDTAPPDLAAVIGYVVWDRYFGKAPDVIGRTLKVNDVPVTIVGVAPRRFAGTRTGGSHVRVWLPLGARPLVQRTPAAVLASYDSAFLGLVARLQPGIEIGQTMPRVRTIAARTAQQTTLGQANRAPSTDVVRLLADNYFPPSGETPGVVGRATTLLIPLLILMITCTNVSALLAGLAAARRREIAVRLSLGAPRRRIVRQLVTESVLLAVAAGALGLFVIWVLWSLFDSRLPDTQLILDWRGLVFTFGFAVATGFLFGISPALHATRVALSEVLKDTASGGVAARRLQSVFVVAQIALTQPALLALGALLLEMTANLHALPSSVFADRILDVRFNTNPRYGTMDQNREAALLRLQTRLAALPGVVAVVPQENTDDYFDVSVHPADRASGVELGPNLPVRAQAAPPGYFALMGIRFVRGGDFAAADEADDSGSVVIGADLARRIWGSEDPIGRRFNGANPSRGNAGRFVVVGVVDEATAGQSDRRDDVQRIFVPHVRITGHLLIRTQGPAQPVIPGVRSVANTDAPELPLVSVRTLAAIEASQRSAIVNVITAIGGGGVLALFLSAIGLYAVVTFAVGQRVREIGIRTALGADHRRIVWMFLFRGLRLSAAGLFVGLTLSVIVVRLMAAARGQELPAGTIGLAALIACVVIGVALLASWVPARRAAYIDPLLALRTD